VGEGFSEHHRTSATEAKGRWWLLEIVIYGYSNSAPQVTHHKERLREETTFSEKKEKNNETMMIPYLRNITHYLLD
jgi:hypothetical protein